MTVEQLARCIAKEQGSDALDDWMGLHEQYEDRFGFDPHSSDQERTAKIQELHDLILAELAAAFDQEWRPQRGDQVEAWLINRRDELAPSPECRTVDDLLDQYRTAADTESPLIHVCPEGI